MLGYPRILFTAVEFHNYPVICIYTHIKRQPCMVLTVSRLRNIFFRIIDSFRFYRRRINLKLLVVASDTAWNQKISFAGFLFKILRHRIKCFNRFSFKSDIDCRNFVTAVFFRIKTNKLHIRKCIFMRVIYKYKITFSFKSILNMKLFFSRRRFGLWLFFRIGNRQFNICRITGIFCFRMAFLTKKSSEFKSGEQSESGDHSRCCNNCSHNNHESKTKSMRSVVSISCKLFPFISTSRIIIFIIYVIVFSIILRQVFYIIIRTVICIICI